MKNILITALWVTGVINLSAADPDFAPAPYSPIKLKGGGHNFVLADVNTDRKPDLVICANTNLTILFGNARGGFDAAANAPINLSHGASEMVTGDFNQDGKLDWAGAHHE